ncbi:MAG: histone H1 [Burkholderiales bacterium]|nr:histone H1 [Phycisphaerae bacterium]
MSLPEWDQLKKLVTDAEEDVAKAVGGNKAAGTRARKKMQDIKSAAQEVRKKILEGRVDGEGDAASPADAAE